MKKILVCITLLFVIVVCIGCSSKAETNISSDTQTKQEVGEKHTWVAATCTSPTMCSDCGLTQGNPLGHDWIPATCIEPKKCSRCLITDGEALGHKWAEATCEEPKTCSRCKETDGKALGHNWVDATCTEAKTCSICGKTDGNPLGHNVNYEVIATASCQNDGKEVGTCSRCGQEITKITPLTDKHDYGEWTEVEKATCSKEGLKKRTCLLCGKVMTETIDKLPHVDDGDFVVVIPASAKGEGKKATHCKVCGEEVQIKVYELTSANGIPIPKDTEDYTVTGSYTYQSYSKQVLIYVVEAKKTVEANLGLIIKDNNGNILDTGGDSISLTAGKLNYFKILVKKEYIDPDNQYQFSESSISPVYNGTENAVTVTHYNRSDEYFYITVEQTLEGLGQYAQLKVLYFNGDELVDSDECYYDKLNKPGDEELIGLRIAMVGFSFVDFTTVDFFYEDY